jgi:hypothetical protein
MDVFKGLHMNTLYYHAVVWIDHREARVFHFSPTDRGAARSSSGSSDSAHPPRGKFDRQRTCGGGSRLPAGVAESIADAGAVLIARPANEKSELAKYIRERSPKVMSAIVGVETVDHSSDAQLVAYARKRFKATDRMSPQVS